MKQFFFLFILFGSYAASFGQQHKVVADKVVGIVGDKIILKSDVINEILDRQRRGEQVPPNAECMVIEQALAMKALVLQAEKDSLVVSDDELEALLENQVRGFIQAYGSKDALEQAWCAFLRGTFEKAAAAELGHDPFEAPQADAEEQQEVVEGIAE